MSIDINGAPVVSIPIAVCLFFMMYPIMVKIDFSNVVQAGKSGKPVFLTLFIKLARQAVFNVCHLDCVFRRSF